MNADAFKTEQLLRSAGFKLNSYPEGNFWELTITDDEIQKRKVATIFAAEFDDCIESSDIDTLILQCDECFSNCLFYYDCNSWDMKIDEFMKCVEKIQ